MPGMNGARRAQSHSSLSRQPPMTQQSGGDTLRVLPSETKVSLRIFLDATMIEAYFQNGRVAMTESLSLSAGAMGSGIALTSKAAGASHTTVTL